MKSQLIIERGFFAFIIQRAEESARSINNELSQASEQNTEPPQELTQDSASSDKDLQDISPTQQTEVSPDLPETERISGVEISRRSFSKVPSRKRKSIKNVQDELRKRRRNRNKVRKVTEDEHEPSLRSKIRSNKRGLHSF